VIGRMPRSALRTPAGDPYPSPHPGGPVGGGYSAPGATHRSVHSDAECLQQRHPNGRCVPVLVVDLEHPDSVRRAAEHLATVVADAEARHQANLAASRQALERLDQSR
jgi:hypothetical protein